MSDRRAELERKKARLLAMREEKKRKAEEKSRKEETPTTLDEPASQGGGLRAETEKMLQDLGIDAEAKPRTSGPAAETTSTATTARTQSVPGHKVQLGVSKVTQTNIPPKEVVAYSKETQTTAEQLQREADSTRSNSPMGSPRSQPYATSAKFDFPNLEWDDEFDEDDDTDSMEVAVDTPPVSAHFKMPQVEMAKPAETYEDLHMQPELVEEKPQIVELSEEEKFRIAKSDDFMKFLDRSTRLMERALDTDIDIMTDYTGEVDEEREDVLAEGEKLKLNRQFFDERWSKHRTVTCIDWSEQHPELLVSSYNTNEDSPLEPDGVALVWNIKYKKNTPEYVFHCQSAVMSTCFAKFHPNLLIGGTYSGQIVLWDNRSSKRTPVQRTPLSAVAHTHPVYCVDVVGTQNAHNLISVSTDGKMCSWNLDMLSHPQDSMELQHKQSKAVAVTSFSFLSGDVNNFVVGSEEGAVYTGCRHGSKAGIGDIFEGHQGPVTGVDCHSVTGEIDFSQYFITSAFDWTVKLWNMKENKPLHSFEDNSDYVYDAKWSPIHPALFAAVDGMGRLDLWNLNKDTEVPTARKYVDSSVALNKCLWHQAGHHIAVGDDMGKVHIYDVGESLAVPKNDEWSRFVHTLQDMKNNQEEREVDSSSFMSVPVR